MRHFEDDSLTEALKQAGATQSTTRSADGHSEKKNPRPMCVRHAPPFKRILGLRSGSFHAQRMVSVSGHRAGSFDSQRLGRGGLRSDLASQHRYFRYPPIAEQGARANAVVRPEFSQDHF